MVRYYHYLLASDRSSRLPDASQVRPEPSPARIRPSLTL